MNALHSRCIRVFISSTFEDLEEERHQVLDALMSLPRVRPVSMEHFGARPQKPIDVCLDEVSQSHIYVLVLGGRYGSIDESGKSFVEREYDKAVEVELPCYVYILKDKSVTQEAIKRQKFIEKLKRGHTFAKVITSALGPQVISDLTPIVGETEIEDARNMLLLLSLYYSIFTPEIAEDLFQSTFQHKGSVYTKVNEIRKKEAWTLLYELGIVKHIRDDKFSLDHSLRNRLRKRIRSDPSLQVFLERFVDYHLDLLNESFAPGKLETTEMIGAECQRYRAALEIADKDLKDQKRVIELTQALVGYWQKREKDTIYWHEGFFVQLQRWDDALYCIQIARNYAQRHGPKSTLADLYYAEAYIHAKCGKNHKAKETAKHALSILGELRHQNDLQQAKFRSVQRWMRQLRNPRRSK